MCDDSRCGALSALRRAVIPRMEHGIAAGVQVRDHAVLCPLRVMAADGVDDTLVFHAALGAVLIVRHRDHNADRRGDDRDEIGQHITVSAMSDSYAPAVMSSLRTLIGLRDSASAMAWRELFL